MVNLNRRDAENAEVTQRPEEAFDMHKTTLLPILLGTLVAAQLACGRINPLASRAAPSPSPNHKELIDQIFARYTEAVGGQEAVEAVSSYQTRGTFETSAARVQGTIESWGKNPNKNLTVITFPGIVEVKKGFDGESHWVQTPFGTFTAAEGATEMSQIERDAEVYRAGKIKSLYYELKLENKVRLSGRDVYMVEGKPERGPAEKLFFDEETGLLVRWDMVRKVPNRGHVFVKVHLDDYREIDGLKVPFKVRFAFESFDFTLKLDEWKHNVSIDDAVFRKPGS